MQRHPVQSLATIIRHGKNGNGCPGNEIRLPRDGNWKHHGLGAGDCLESHVVTASGSV